MSLIVISSLYIKCLAKFIAQCRFANFAKRHTFLPDDAKEPLLKSSLRNPQRYGILPYLPLFSESHSHPAVALVYRADHRVAQIDFGLWGAVGDVQLGRKAG
jgi:hypothetical protein